MKSDAKTRSIIVGIFDNVQDLKRAVERLAAAGFEDTLYDEAIVALDAGNVAPVGPVPMDPVLAPGSCGGFEQRRTRFAHHCPGL